MAKPELVIEALGVLKVVLLNCWVRIVGEEGGRWRGEVVRGVVGSWGCVCEFEGGGEGGEVEVENVKREIGVVGRLLGAVVEKGGVEGRERFWGDVERLVEVNGGLREVFGVGG